MSRVIGGKKEAKAYAIWQMKNPNATKEEHHAFLQSLLDERMKAEAQPTDVPNPTQPYLRGASPRKSAGGL